MNPSSLLRKIVEYGDRPLVAIVLVGLVAFCGAAAVGLGIQIHEPEISDEYSYLLAADTFAHGRLANEPHPMWEHFESLHINQQPTYASKYPPAQGLFLAAGQVLTGLPIVGVWLSTALMCAAVTWMLLAWFHVRWAALGGLLAAAHYGVVGPWAQGYWGGAVAALGGCFVLGALPRLVENARARDSVVLGLGVALLANSRPFEGLLFSLAAGAVLGVHLFRQRAAPLRGSVATIVLPAAFVLAGAFAWMGYYSFRVSGDPLKLPYAVNNETYSPVPLFLFQPAVASTPESRHPRLRQVFESWSEHWSENPGPPEQWPGFARRRLGKIWRFYLGVLWSLPLLALPWLLRDRWMSFCLAASSVVAASTLFTTFGGWPHYVAPAAGAVVALIVKSLEVATSRWPGKRVGRLLVAAFFIATLVTSARAIVNHSRPQITKSETRSGILAWLEDRPSEHLVIVHYGPSQNRQKWWELVYNRASIDDARIVWARSMGPERNKALIEYFSDRKVWLCRVTPNKVSLVPHPLATRSRPGEE